MKTMRKSLPTAFGLALAGLVLAGLGADSAGAACTSLAGAPACDGRRAHAEVGRTVIFPHGPAGQRIGDFVQPAPGALPEVVPGEQRAADAPASRPLDRADRLTDPTRGRDFGAFEFPTGRRFSTPLR